MDIDIKALELFIIKRNCEKCGYQWFPRSQNPKKCPCCQTWLVNPVENKKASEEKGSQNK